MSRKSQFLTNAFEFILYTSNQNHIDIINMITNSNDIRYIGICHDRDTYTDEDLNEALIDGREITWQVGDLKKEHYHFYLYFNQNTSIDELLSLFPIEKNNIQFIANEKEALIYLLHRNRPEKYQYSIVDVVYNDIALFNKLKKYINQEELKDENLGSSKIVKYINEYPRMLSIASLTNYVLTNNLWSVYRRGFAIFCKLVQEHNINLE